MPGSWRRARCCPGERAMAEEYHVAIGTIRSAIEELRSRGLAVTYPGKGTYVVQRGE
jgi:GntR family transcriptional regulator